MTELIGAPPAIRRIRFDPTRARGGEDYDHAHRHSRRVGWLKIGLPVLAAVGVIGFFLAMRFEAGSGGVSLAGIDIEDKSLIMKTPHISGFDGTRRAYEVTATRAVQNLDNPKVVTLDAINAKFGLEGGGSATLKAATGVYDGNANLLTLKDGIAVITTDGYQAKLVDASVDVKNGTLVSQRPIEISSADGTIKANGIAISERGKHVKFLGGVSVNFIPPDGAFAAPAATNPTP
jgi:lipopolysaccharide export system protein LptC